MDRLKIEAFYDLRREKLQRWWDAWRRENFADVNDFVHDDNLIDNLIDNHVDNVDHDIDNVVDDNDDRVDDDDYDNNDDDDDNADDLCKLSARCRRFA